MAIKGGEWIGYVCEWCYFFFSSRRRHTRFDCDWSSDVCSSDLTPEEERLLSMFADQAALALESARVRGESEQRRREAEALALVAQRLTETLDVDRKSVV